MIYETHSKGSARTISSRLRNLLRLVQGDTPLEKFIEQLREGEKQLIVDFGSHTHPGFIKIGHLIENIFINGIEQEYFSTKIEQLLEKNPSGYSDDHWNTINSFQLYKVAKSNLSAHSSNSTIQTSE